jgi:DNA polymerase III gamma/tau subunit
MAAPNALFPEMLPAVQGGLGFPEPLTEKYAPKTLDEFVGMENVIKPLKGFAAKLSAANDIAGSRGFVFHGSSGTGKTRMAFAFAREVQGEVHHIPAQECTIETIRDLAYNCRHVPTKGAPTWEALRYHVIIVDEADLMSPAAQNACLSYLDGTNPLPNTIWIFTCNAVERFADRFLSRNMQFDFSSYGLAKGAIALLERVWKLERGQTASDSQPNFARIVKDSANNIRAALQALELELMAA